MRNLKKVVNFVITRIEERDVMKFTFSYPI